MIVRLGRRVQHGPNGSTSAELRCERDDVLSSVNRALRIAPSESGRVQRQQTLDSSAILRGAVSGAGASRLRERAVASKVEPGVARLKMLAKCCRNRTPILYLTTIGSRTAFTYVVFPPVMHPWRAGMKRPRLSYPRSVSLRLLGGKPRALKRATARPARAASRCWPRSGVPRGG
jgi:hypothetical protein